MLAAAILQVIGFAMIAASMHAAPPALRRLAANRRGRVVVAGWTLLALSAAAALAQGDVGRRLVTLIALSSPSAAAVLIACTVLRLIGQRRR